jgi:hypothetical protein
MITSRWKVLGVFALVLSTQDAGARQGPRGAAPGPAPRPPNLCKCVPPISAQASGPGACTRTQDDGTFCQLDFVSAQVAAGVVNDLAFGSFSSQMKMMSVQPSDLVRAVQRVQANQFAGLSSADLAASVHAVAMVAAFERSGDATTRSHFTDVLDLTNPANLQPPVVDTLQQYAKLATAERVPVQSRKVPLRGRQYELRVTPGCLAFLESTFVFTVRGVAEATPCTSGQ